MQEGAVLARGMAGEARSVAGLRAILLDDAAARERLGSGERSVGPRLRAYAAFALGLVGQRTRDEATRLTVVHALLDALGNERSATREIQVACALSAGLIGLEFCGDDPARAERHRMEGDRHLCGGVLLKYLLDVLRQADLDPALRAHAAPSIGRLARGAPAEFRQAALDELVLRARVATKEPAEVRCGSAIGLGLFADGVDEERDARAVAELARLAKDDDALVARLALVALGQAAGRDALGRSRAASQALTALNSELARARSGRRAWAALALSVLGHQRLEVRGVLGREVVDALASALARTRDPGEATPLVLALGILRDDRAAEVVLQSFERIRDDRFRSAATLTLGLLGVQGGRGAAQAWLGARESTEESEEVAIGLRLLGDAGLLPSLLERLASTTAPAAKAKRVSALGKLGDRRAKEPLLALLTDPSEDRLVRAAAARALADLVDPDPHRLAAAFATDVNYSLLTWTLESPLGDGSGLLEQR
jgi:hypothetical protein